MGETAVVKLPLSENILISLYFPAEEIVVLIHSTFYIHASRMMAAGIATSFGAGNISIKNERITNNL